MRLRTTPALLIIVFAASAPVRAAGPPSVEEATAPTSPRVEVHGLIDVRFAGNSAQTAWLDGGFGRARYGGTDRNRDGHADHTAYTFHASQLSLVVDGKLSDELMGHVQLNADTDLDRAGLLGRVGLVEGFAQWSPVLGSTTRLRLRAGVTIPPFSLEHPEVAWSTRYTITPSAIGSWIGEELKSTGVEGTLLIDLPSFSQLELQAAVFGGNDSTGALLAWRGWALHDRQSQIGDDLPLPPVLSLTDARFFTNQGLSTNPFHEIDGRPGYHAQAKLHLRSHLMLQGAWYDNRGDVNATIPGAYTWNTHFAVAGAQLDWGPLTLLGQFMDGRAKMGFVDPARLDAPFRAGYFLASVATPGSGRLSLRGDRFQVRDRDRWQAGKDLNTDDGWAGTIAYMQKLGAHAQLEAEELVVNAEHPFAVTAGEPADFTQYQFQAGCRLRF